MRLACIFFTLAIAACPAVLPAAWASEWKPFGLQGTILRSLASTADLLCAGTQDQGVYCLDLEAPDLGWEGIGPPGLTVTWLWIDPEDPDVRFAAVPGFPALYRTLNGGASWEPVAGVPNAYAVQGVTGSPTVFSAGGRIWRSDDSGTSWESLWDGGGLVSLEVAESDADAVWAGGETVIFMGFTIRSLDGGINWETVWDSRLIGDNQTADISAHPGIPGLTLTGHEGFVLRTENQGATFTEVLTAPARFFLDWDGGNPARAYAAGSPNGPDQGHAFVSPDFGLTWTDVTGTTLATRTIYRLEADDKRVGVAYAATDDGVYRFYGGGLPVCLDTRGGFDALRLEKGACPAARSPGRARWGDVVAAELDGLALAGDRIDLGEVECVVADGDIAYTTLDIPDPAPGRAIAILARRRGASDYGTGSGGLPRLASLGDCP